LSTDRQNSAACAEISIAADNSQQPVSEDHQAAGDSFEQTSSTADCLTVAGEQQTVVAQLQEQLSQCRADLAKFRKDSAISRIDTWAGCPKEVDSIPYEVDGLQQYVLKCSKDMMKVSQNGRPWNT